MNYYFLMAPKAFCDDATKHLPPKLCCTRYLKGTGASSFCLCCAMNMVVSFIPPSIVLADLLPGRLLSLLIISY